MCKNLEIVITKEFEKSCQIFCGTFDEIFMSVSGLVKFYRSIRLAAQMMSAGDCGEEKTSPVMYFMNKSIFLPILHIPFSV